MKFLTRCGKKARRSNRMGSSFAMGFHSAWDDACPFRKRRYAKEWARGKKIGRFRFVAMAGILAFVVKGVGRVHPSR